MWLCIYGYGHQHDFQNGFEKYSILHPHFRYRPETTVFHSAHDGEGPSSKLFLDQDFDFCPPKFRVPRARVTTPTVILCSTWFYLGLLCSTSTLFHFVPLCSTLFHFVRLCSALFCVVPLCCNLLQFVHFCTSCSPGIELAQT